MIWHGAGGREGMGWSAWRGGGGVWLVQVSVPKDDRLWCPQGVARRHRKCFIVDLRVGCRVLPRGVFAGVRQACCRSEGAHGGDGSGVGRWPDRPVWMSPLALKRASRRAEEPNHTCNAWRGGGGVRSGKGGGRGAPTSAGPCGDQTTCVPTLASMGTRGFESWSIIWGKKNCIISPRG